MKRAIFLMVLLISFLRYMLSDYLYIGTVKKMRTTIFALALVLGSIAGVVTFGQTNFYSKSAGNLDALATWGQNTDGTGAAPVDFISDNQIFNIRNNATPAIGTDWTVSGAGSGVIVGNGTIACTFTVPAALIFTATCTISNNGTLRITSTNATPYSGTLTVNSGGSYEHAKDGGTIPTATWNPASNCNIIGITASIGFSGGLAGQTFGNFIWNCPDQSTNFYLEASFTVAGNFIVSQTGAAGHTVRSLRMSTSGIGYSIAVTGNLIVENNATFKMNNSNGSCQMDIGGNFLLNSGYFTIVTGNANSILNVTGNVNISDGYLIMKEDANAIQGTLNVKGNFTQSGGTITLLDGPLGTGAINFNGNTPQTYSKTGGTISNAINFTINSGAILNVGTSIIDGSSGTFMLSPGAGIITAHPDGLSPEPDLTGSIQVTGVRTFDPGADYTYNGLAAQVTGNGLPVTVHNLTINNANNVSLTNGVTVNGNQTLTSGALNLTGKALAISSTGLVACSGTGTINGNAGSSFTVNSTAASGFPPGIYQDVTINSAGGVTMCGNATVNGILTLTIGKINLSSYNLTINSAGQIAGGTASSYINAESTGTLKQYVNSANKVFPIGTSTSFLPVTLNNTGGIADNYSVNLFGTVTDNGLSTGTSVPFLENTVKRTWRIAEDVAGGSNFTLTTQWNGSDEGSIFDRSDCFIGYNDGSDWLLPPGSSAAVGTDPYTQTRAGIVTVGSFAVGQNCTFGDNTIPTITCPSDISLNNEAGSCLASVVTPNPVTNDNCRVYKLTWILTGATIANSPATGMNYVGTRIFNIGITTVTYIVSDVASNTASCSFTVTVNDTEKPIISGCPANIVQVNDAGNCSAVASWIEPTAADNCTTAGSLVWAKSHLPGDVFNVGTTTVTYTATDAATNVSNICSFTVTVTDNIIPSIACPGDRTEYLNDNCQFIIPDYTSSVSVIDNCDPVPSVSQSPAAGTILSGEGTVQAITILSTDSSGNSGSCIFKIVLHDNTPPVIICLPDTTITVEKGIYRIKVSLSAPVTTDNCGIQSVINDFNGGADASGIYQVGITTVIYTVTDQSGNTVQCSQQIIVRSSEVLPFGLVIPQGFSPNNDGLNDTFDILGMEAYPENELFVYNLWGYEVYYMHRYNNSWDGTASRGALSDQKLPTGTYYYILKLDNALVVKGFVYLIKD